MDLPLQNTTTAPVKAQQMPKIGAVIAKSEPPTAATTPEKSVAPTEMGAIGAVNASRISGQSPTIPAVTAAERILKPYGVTMLPRSESTEKLV